MPKITKAPRALRLAGKSTTVRLADYQWGKLDSLAKGYGMTWQALLNQAMAEQGGTSASVEQSAAILIDYLLAEPDTESDDLSEFNAHPLRQACNTWQQGDLQRLLKDPAAESIKMVEGESNYGSFVLRFGYYDETPIMIIDNQLNEWPSAVFTLGAN